MEKALRDEAPHSDLREFFTAGITATDFNESSTGMEEADEDGASSTSEDEGGLRGGSHSQNNPILPWLRIESTPKRSPKSILFLVLAAKKGHSEGPYRA